MSAGAPPGWVARPLVSGRRPARRGRLGGHSTEIQRMSPPEPTGGTARFVCGNMWGAPLGEAEVVVIYGVDELMADFRQSKSSAACANADVTCRDRLTYD